MKIEDIIEIVEDFAPLSLQEDWDNSGLQVGRVKGEVSGVVLALDVTLAVVERAKMEGANLIISHHPLLFDGIKSVTERSVEGRIILDAIKGGITIYSSHTPLDACAGGINDRLAGLLGLENVKVLGDELSTSGIGRVGELKSEMSAEKFAARLAKIFHLPCVRATNTVRPVRRVALCSGSGGSLLEKAIDSGADCYICGDLKYHNFGVADNVITLMDIGHAESELCAVDIFMELLVSKTKKIPIFATRDSYVRYI